MESPFSEFLNLLIALCVSILILVVYLVQVYQAARQLPRIEPSEQVEQAASANAQFPKVSIVIPAFNEEDNIEACVSSVLLSSQLPAEKLEVWVIDDRSTDRTWEILNTLQAQCGDPRLKLLSGLPMPVDRIWTGKNWACHQAVAHADGEFLLFIDADVRLQPNIVSPVVQVVLDRQLDFLTCIPTIVCGSWVEWLVQPLIFINLLITFNSSVVKDPSTKTTYALGPFLLFRKSAYHAIGGHKAVADQVAEDVALVQRLKAKGFKLQHFLGINLATLRMYRSWSTLWEGWTKVLYVGANRKISLMLLLVIVMLLIYTVPWLGLLIVTPRVLQQPTLLNGLVMGLSVLALSLQYWLRQQGSLALGMTPRYWWLQGAGGLVLSAIAIASVIKTETGWGWTWRGRQLKLTKEIK